ncbi:hypothetical protein GCM10018781_23630 [Kitasatospora indigofera]|uniref:Uncharacterized protein n=1 Tax=Kitasatospora indigofera TaxID=67307 RepID=A0A919FLN9_9ACTN|nr:hypothetical protein [Kitasatospora indigofera]GHH67800.1 hypothetical protein GCM10018781_23630 [Kitasatospora indigofera]
MRPATVTILLAILTTAGCGSASGGSTANPASSGSVSLTYLQKAGTECTSGDYTAMSADLKIGIHHVAGVTDQVTG